MYMLQRFTAICCLLRIIIVNYTVSQKSMQYAAMQPAKERYATCNILLHYRVRIENPKNVTDFSL